MENIQYGPCRLLLFTIFLFGANCQDNEDVTLKYQILEELSPNTPIGNIVIDGKLNAQYDPSVLSQLRFSFLSQPSDEANHFVIEERTGSIRTKDRIDRDQICSGKLDCQINLDIAVKPTQYFQIIKVLVNINDINDNSPSFPLKTVVQHLSETSSPGLGFSIPSAVDPDSDKFGIQSYELVSNTKTFQLQVSKNIGGLATLQIKLTNSLDREKVGFYQLKVVARDGGNPERSGSVFINITIDDANDNHPVFNSTLYEVSVTENKLPGTVVVRVKADDADKGPNGQVFYGFTLQTTSAFGHLFGINNSTGEIFVKQLLDFEQGSLYNLMVVAMDLGPNAQPSHATVVVNVVDLNDNAPKITVSTLTKSGIAELSEYSPLGTFVAHISVVDVDKEESGIFSCTLEGNQVKLQVYKSAKDYKIVTAAMLDHEKQSQFEVIFRCQDKGSPSKTSEERIKVIVVDENDHAPVFSKLLYTVRMTENNQAGQMILRVNATDEDSGKNGRIRYSLTQNVRNILRIDPASGTILAKAPFDRENIPDLTFTVLATDHGTPLRTASASVVLTITDINDVAPRFSQTYYEMFVTENLPVDASVGTVKAIDTDAEPSNQFFFSLVDDGVTKKIFKIDARTGQLFTKQTLDRESVPMYNLIVTAIDRGVPPLTSSANVAVFVRDANDHTPRIYFPNQHNNTVYVSNHVYIGYEVTQIFAKDSDSGNNAMLRFSIAAGNDQEFFTINSHTGRITVNARLNTIDSKVFRLTIKVKDRGTLPRSVSGILNVVVNRSTSDHFGEASLLGSNVTIVISLVSASGLLVVVLIIAIVIIRRQDKSKYNGPMNIGDTETSKMYQVENYTNARSGETLSKLSNGLNPESNNKQPPTGGRLPDNRNQNAGAPDFRQNHGNKTFSTTQCAQATLLPHAEEPFFQGRSWLNPNDMGDNSSISEASDRPAVCNGDKVTPRQRLIYVPPVSLEKTWNLTQGAVKAHQMMGLDRRDPDADSACSGEMSNTDSGHGASEEGDIPNQQSGVAMHQGNTPLLSSPDKKVGNEDILKENKYLLNRTSNHNLPKNPERKTGVSLCDTMKPKRTFHANDPNGFEKKRAVHWNSPVVPERRTRIPVSNNSFSSSLCEIMKPMTQHMQVPRHIELPCTDDVTDDGASSTSGSYVIEHDGIVTLADESLFTDLVV